MSPFLLFLLAAACLLAAALSAAAARSLRDFSRSRLEELSREVGALPVFSEITERRELAMLGAESLQVLATSAAVLAGAGWLMATGGADGPPSAATLVIAVLIGIIMLWLAVVWLPPAMARFYAEPFLLRTWRLWWLVGRTLAPSVWGAQGALALLSRFAGKSVDPTPEEAEEAVAEEIRTIVTESHREGLMEEDARVMIESIMALNEVTAAQVMTRRTEMTIMAADLSIEAAARCVAESRHTRVPIFQGGREEIVGIVHAKDLLAELSKTPSERLPLVEIARKPYFVPETKAIDELLQQFQQSQNHIAVVIDEFGGVSGLLTIEDVLEEIVGEIADEHDEALADGIKRIDERSSEALARVRIAEINERLGLSLPDEEHFDTIGGFVFHELGRIPQVGEDLIHGDVRISVLAASRRRIDRVRIEVLEREAATETVN